MGMFGLLMKKNVLEQLRDLKRNSLFIFLPVAIFACFYFYYQINDVEMSFVKPMKVGVVLEDDSVYSQMLVNDFGSKKDLADFFQLIEGERSRLEADFAEGQLDALAIIPSGFVKSLMSFDENPVRIIIRDEDPVRTMILHNAFKGYERYITSVEKGVTSFYHVFREEVDPDIYWEYNDALSVELIMTALNRNGMYGFDSIVDIPSAVSVKYYFIALTVMFVFVLSLFSGISLVRESKSQSFMRLRTTSVSLTMYLFAKVLSYGLMILVTLAVWIAIFGLFTGEWMFLGTPGPMLLMVSAILLSVVTSMVIAVMLGDEQELMLVSSIFIFFSAIVGGSIIPLHYMPEGLRKLAYATPNFHLIKAFLYMDAGYEVQGYELAVPVMLLAACAGTFLLSHSFHQRIRRASYD